LKEAIGADVLAVLEQQTGLSQEELLARLSRELLLPLTSIRQTDAFQIERRYKEENLNGHHLNYRHWFEYPSF
jgi:hypothetical protein